MGCSCSCPQVQQCLAPSARAAAGGEVAEEEMQITASSRSTPASPARFTREDFEPNERVLRRGLQGWIHTARPPNVTSGNLPLAHCMRVFGCWPVGDGAGELLAEPDVDDTPVAERGISREWFEAAWWRMKQDARTEYPKIPTLAFVEGLCLPLASKHRCALFFLVPRAFRAKPDTLVTHSWDTWLRHLFFFPQDSRTERHVLWVDALAMDLHSAPPADPSARRAVAQAVPRTLVVLPGDGCVAWSLRVVQRGQCFLEILCAQEVGLLGGLHDVQDVDFHAAMVQGLDQLAVDALDVPADECAQFDSALADLAHGDDPAAVVRDKLKHAFSLKYGGAAQPVGSQGLEVADLYRGSGSSETAAVTPLREADRE